MYLIMYILFQNIFKSYNFKPFNLRFKTNLALILSLLFFGKNLKRIKLNQRVTVHLKCVINMSYLIQVNLRTLSIR